MTATAEALVLANLELVEKVASRMARRLPAWIDMDELISLGNVGLVEAANRFDPERHVSFAVYAMLRIRGQMIDAYRGRNYPRLFEGMPEAWMQGGREADAEEVVAPRTPECLVNRESTLETLIERERSVVVCIDAVRARRELDEVEGRAFDRHVNGSSLRDIGRQEGKSGAWSHYVVRRARTKMRLALGVIEGGKGKKAA
jgi:RNA polymerase sigma factor (sigma-70 family)